MFQHKMEFKKNNKLTRRKHFYFNKLSGMALSFVKQNKNDPSYVMNLVFTVLVRHLVFKQSTCP